MCKAVREIKSDARRQGFRHGRKSGLLEGKAIGEARGRAETIKSIVMRLLKRRTSMHEICDITGASVDDIRQIELSMQLENA